VTEEEKKLLDQIPIMWSRIDDAQKRSTEAKTLSQYLNNNVVQAIVISQKAMNDVTDLKNIITDLKNVIKEVKDGQNGLLLKFAGIVTLIFTIFGGLIALTGFLLKLNIK